MAEKKLTPKQKRFVDEYLIDLNATQAAIRAGYSKKTANEQAGRLLVNVSVREQISRRQAARVERTQIDQDFVLTELLPLAASRVTDFVKVRRKYLTGLDGLEREYTVVDVIPTDEIPKDKLGAISSIKQGPNGIEIKFHDKTRALELIGKHVGMFKDDDTASADALTKLDAILDGVSRKMAEDDGD